MKLLSGSGVLRGTEIKIGNFSPDAVALNAAEYNYPLQCNYFNDFFFE
jgi:hypothetical protein